MRGLLVYGMFALLLAVALNTAGAEEAESYGSEMEFARNELGLFLGATTTELETKFTIGADYEFRPMDYLGFGIVAEYSGGESREWMVVLPVISHPNRDLEGGWKLILGPGLEIRDGGTDFLVRLGISYGFPVDGWTISPEFDADLVFGEWSYVYGLKFGRGF